jgi:hypothetical protein
MACPLRYMDAHGVSRRRESGLGATWWDESLPQHAEFGSQHGSKTTWWNRIPGSTKRRSSGAITGSESHGGKGVRFNWEAEFDSHHEPEATWHRMCPPKQGGGVLGAAMGPEPHNNIGYRLISESEFEGHRRQNPQLTLHKNSNRRHGSKTHAKPIVFDMKKWDASTSPRSKTGSVENRKETICFSTRLS